MHKIGHRYIKFELDFVIECYGYYCFGLKTLDLTMFVLKVPKREIFHRSDSPDFYTIKSSWVGDLLVKILTYYFNF